MNPLVNSIFFFFAIQALTESWLFFNMKGFLSNPIIIFSTFVDNSVEIIMQVYDSCVEYLKEKFDSPTFINWILPLSFVGHTNNILFIGSPDQKKTNWFNDNVLKDLNDFTNNNFGVTIKLLPLYSEDLVLTVPDEGFRRTYQERKIESNLKKKYTFDSFVQTDANRMAYSFAHSVSEFPGKSYNPLYIYSDVGLGKTHLMQAIGNRIISVHNNLNVVYTTTSEFMHEYVEFNRLNKRPEFINKYTSIDVLLIDDIQYITKWGGTREQFYNIFNKLIQNEKQIVICSDKHPDNLPDLENRIKSRFEWGGIVDIAHYELEDRIAILKNKLPERRHLSKVEFFIPDEVLYFLASSIRDNIRKLEGALNRLIGYANLKFSDSQSNQISLEFAKEALKPYINIRSTSITVESIQDFVSKKYNLKTEELIAKNNAKKITEPRQIAIYLTKKLTKLSLAEIGQHFGGKHHTTILHSLNKVELSIQDNAEFSRMISSFLSFFQN
jgi:chromosomal replication initiator protein